MSLPISDESKMDFPHPFLVLSDNQNICQTWETAFNNPKFKSKYDILTETEKNTIYSNLKTRTCQSVDNVMQCFTINGEFETCKNLQDEEPKSIRKIMSEIDTITNSKKGTMIQNLNKFVNKKREVVDNLINNYISRKEMLDMHSGFMSLADQNIERNIEEKNMLADDLNKTQELKEFTNSELSKTRSDIEWYNYRYKILITVVKVLLSILILIEFIYILMIKL
jgi:hypothetical protein